MCVCLFFLGVCECSFFLGCLRLFVFFMFCECYLCLFLGVSEDVCCVLVQVISNETQ